MPHDYDAELCALAAVAGDVGAGLYLLCPGGQAEAQCCLNLKTSDLAALRRVLEAVKREGLKPR